MVDRRIKLLALLLVLLPCAAARAENLQRHLLEISWAPRGERAALLFSLCEADSRVCSGFELALMEEGGEVRRHRLPGLSARLAGWTPDGRSVVVDQGPGRLTVQPAEGGLPTTLRLPEAAVSLGSDGRRAFYLSENRRHLLSTDAEGQTRVVASLPAGFRPPGALDSEGRRLALRRSVRGPRGWGTEIWVVADGAVRRAAVVDDAMVRVSWHPSRPALLLNAPDGAGTWSSTVVELRGDRWERVGGHSGLPSPLQWDRSGRLYAADVRGLVEIKSGKRVRDWSPASGRLMLWALSPGGQQVLAGLEEREGDTEVLLFPVPGGAGVPLPAGSTSAR